MVRILKDIIGFKEESVEDEGDVENNQEVDEILIDRQGTQGDKGGGEGEGSGT